MKNVKEIGRQVIDRLGPSDLAAVIFTRDNRNSQDFTADHARLLAAVNKFTSASATWAPAGIVGGDDLYFMYSVGVLRRPSRRSARCPTAGSRSCTSGQGVPVDVGSRRAPGYPDCR